MTKSSRTDANQMLLPLEEFLAERAGRSNAARPIGEVVADVVKRMGRPHEGGDGGRHEASPKESRDTRGARSFRRAHTATPHTVAAASLVVVCVLQRDRDEAEHHAGSETWIEF